VKRFVVLAICAGCSHSPGASTSDGAPVSGSDAAMMTVDDGTPTRQTCTSSFGNALSAQPTFGRLDGFLVAIVPPGNMASCNDDDSHVHLQVRMNGAIYDVAIDVTDAATHMDDVHTTTLDVPMPDGEPWTEGWHTGATVLADYVALGVHDTALTLETKGALVQLIQTDLATANHVSVYTTSYGPDGGHLVHRNGGGHDGILVTEPLSSPSHLRLFSFTDQSF
jgi:hypothetical protein